MAFFKASKFFLMGAVISVILVGTTTLFPFIVTKYTFFRIMVDFAAIFFLLGYIFRTSFFETMYKERVRRVLRSPLFIAVAAFTFFFVLSSFFAYDPQYAIWSNFERGEGAFQMVHFFAFFSLLAMLFKDEGDWKKIFKLSIATGGVMLLYGVLAGFGVKGFVGPAFSGGARFHGSLGNAAYVGVYMMFAIFYLAYLSFHEQAKKMGYGILMVIAAVFVWLTQTRGPVYGLGAGVIALLIYMLARSGWKWKKQAFALFAACVIVGGGLIYFHDTPFVRALPGSRLFNIGFSSSSWQSRLWTWESAIKGFEERPLLGWGPENFAVVFDKHFDVRHYVPGVASETWYDRAHSVYLDYLVETGIFGFLAFVSIFVAYYVQFVKKNRELDAIQEKNKTEKDKRIFERALFFALPIAYLMQGVVLFDILPTYINLFLFLAFAVWKFQPSSIDHVKKIR